MIPCVQPMVRSWRLLAEGTPVRVNVAFARPSTYRIRTPLAVRVACGARCLYHPCGSPFLSEPPAECRARSARSTTLSGATSFRMLIPSSESPIPSTQYCPLRFGILAAVFYNVFWTLPFLFPLTSDLSVWYAGTSMIIFIAITALTVYAFSIARAGRPLLRDDLLQE